MSESDIRAVERFILEAVASQPVGPDALLAMAAKSDVVRKYSPAAITTVIWNLVSRGKVAWTSDHELSAAA